MFGIPVISIILFLVSLVIDIFVGISLITEALFPDPVFDMSSLISRKVREKRVRRAQVTWAIVSVVFFFAAVISSALI